MCWENVQNFTGSLSVNYFNINYIDLTIQMDGNQQISSVNCVAYVIPDSLFQNLKDDADDGSFVTNEETSGVQSFYTTRHSNIFTIWEFFWSHLLRGVIFSRGNAKNMTRINWQILHISSDKMWKIDFFYIDPEYVLRRKGC